MKEVWSQRGESILLGGTQLHKFSHMFNLAPISLIGHQLWLIITIVTRPAIYSQGIPMWTNNVNIAMKHCKIDDCTFWASTWKLGSRYRKNVHRRLTCEHCGHRHTVRDNFNLNRHINNHHQGLQQQQQEVDQADQAGGPAEEPIASIPPMPHLLWWGNVRRLAIRTWRWAGRNWKDGAAETTTEATDRIRRPPNYIWGHIWSGVPYRQPRDKSRRCRQRIQIPPLIQRSRTQHVGAPATCGAWVTSSLVLAGSRPIKSQTGQ